MTTTSFTIDAARQQALLDRFVRYAKVHTASSESSDTFPSTEGQWDLLRMLEQELQALGLADVTLDEHGYLFATLPSNLPSDQAAPTIGLLAHVDTYPGTSGKDVKPQILDYQGGDIVLPGDPTQVIPASHPQLQMCVGHRIITSDGTTLLGADDKAGVAIIMTLLDFLISHPEVPHGALRIGFTPDEEIGAGTRYFDVERFGAQAAYTFDGSMLGEIEDETFCADAATVVVTGFDVHPGSAKNAMVSAIRAAARLVELLPKDHLPETTEGRESFLHPVSIGGEVGEVTVRFIVRGFTDEALAEREADLQKFAAQIETEFPGARAAITFKPQYRNMKQVLDTRPEVMALALEAVRKSGLDPIQSSIRGGTDGAQLSFKGLPTPNVFAGGVNFHGKQEWVSLTWMSKSVETGLNLVALWAEHVR
ncbi:MAG: peptidase T [Myxococcales bacterium]|jgi:tripeptide aminopeptidase|nr:peptidase T [Myxococcales bacterium]